MRSSSPILVALATILGIALGSPAFALRGTVIDRATREPLPEAIVTLGATVSRSDPLGRFEISGPGERLAARAPGYLRTDLAIESLGAGPDVVIALTPFAPKALYLSFYGIGSRALRESALELIEETELNALVIDVKGDRGGVPYRSFVAGVEEAGAQKIITVPNVREILALLKERGIYCIARIVVFKDDLLATARPELAVKAADGRTWHDREQLAWTDPFRHEVWDYNIDIAVEAARLGFDEIQFDYMRFPEMTGLIYSQPNSERNRVDAIAGFLREARGRLAPYNVFLAGDIFGYVAWNADDTHIGQRLEDLASLLDYISPMLYPSGFQFGIPGYADPVAHPYEIVHASLEKARLRTGLPPQRFRPWLQAFRDYAFDHRPFSGTEVRTQIRAAEDFGSNGWMLWNPNNRYSRDGLRDADPRPAVPPK